MRISYAAIVAALFAASPAMAQVSIQPGDNGAPHHEYNDSGRNDYSGAGRQDYSDSSRHADNDTARADRQREQAYNGGDAEHDYNDSARRADESSMAQEQRRYDSRLDADRGDYAARRDQEENREGWVRGRDQADRNDNGGVTVRLGQ